jgi:GT2 family glycosyltransferase
MASIIKLPENASPLPENETISQQNCSVIILNYNGKETLGPLLDSVYGQKRYVQEIIVLDNRSNDGSDILAAHWCEKKENARYHQFPDNIGFARAMNWGIANSSGDFICLLNADILLDSNYIETCTNVLRNNKGVGMVSGVIYRLVKGKKTDIIDSLGLGLHKDRYHDDIGAGTLAKGPLQTTYPFGVCGCAPVYSREMINAISHDEPPFFELFESYSEDVDLAWRARKLGWKAVCTIETMAWHVREGSLKNKKLRAIARNRNHRNRIWLMVLNERPSILFQHICHWLPLQTFFILKAFIQPGIFLAYFDTIWRMPQIIKVRMRRNIYPSVLLKNEEEKLFSLSKGIYFKKTGKRFFNFLYKLNWNLKRKT